MLPKNWVVKKFSSAAKLAIEKSYLRITNSNEILLINHSLKQVHYVSSILHPEINLFFYLILTIVNFLLIILLFYYPSEYWIDAREGS